MADAKQWMLDRGFKMVCDPMRGGYAAGFDQDVDNQFMRAEWEEPQVFRLADAHPLFNVWGLYYRPLDTFPRAT